MVDTTEMAESRPFAAMPPTRLERHPRRVLMTTDPLGGVWSYAVELARALGEEGVEVILASLGGEPSEDQRREVEELPLATLRHRSFRLEWMEDPWDDVAASGAWLLELEAETGPDLVHLNQLSFGDLPWSAPHLVVGHSCVLSWWRAVQGEDAPTGWNRYREQVRRSLEATPMIVAPTRTMLDALVDHYGPFPAAGHTREDDAPAASRGRVIPNARAAEHYEPAWEKEETVLAAGRLWDEAKNLEALVRVAPSLGWPVLVAGPAEHPETGRPALPAGTSHGLHLLGRLPAEELARWMGRASIFAHPARYEPFGLTVLEAALAGCTLVLGAIPSLEENWTGAALFADPDDPQALGHALDRVIEDPDLACGLAFRARARALELSPGRQARSYLTAYRDLARISQLERMDRAARTATAAPSEASPLLRRRAS